jgi:hypothetical protein
VPALFFAHLFHISLMCLCRFGRPSGISLHPSAGNPTSPIDRCCSETRGFLYSFNKIVLRIRLMRYASSQ